MDLINGVITVIVAQLIWCISEACNVTRCNTNQAYEDARAREDITEACKLLGEVLYCQEQEAIICREYAEAGGEYPEWLDIEIETNSNELQKCPQPGEHCLTIANCLFDSLEFQRTLEAFRIPEACAIIGPSVVCLRAAIKDCKVHGFLKGDELKKTTLLLVSSEALLDKHCSSHPSDEAVDDGRNSVQGMTSLRIVLLAAILLVIAFNTDTFSNVIIGLTT